jgi:hypothetical protein
MNRSAPVLVVVALAVGFLAGQAGPLLAPAQAQDQAAPVGRYQISTIPGAVYLVDSTTGDLFVREYQTGEWREAGNPRGTK